MLASIGAKTTEELFEPIPGSLKLNRLLNLPPALSEQEVLGHLEDLAGKNKLSGELSFLGAGAYRRYIPSVVDMVIQRSEFMTAYTPYQPEVSQGTLQTIFEFQSLICNLTGMDVANASVYDGGCAAVDAVFMALSITGRKKVAVSAGVHPQTLELLRTYISHQVGELTVLPLKDGATQLTGLDDETACVIFQEPNFLGIIEDGPALCRQIAEAGALSVVAVGDPVSLSVLKRPGDFPADIAVGDAQAIGLPPSFGGPYAGFVACKKAHMRRIPGRLCGITVDTQGRRAYCLTLQAREQHIRRDKAFSNICTNQGLCALAVTVYLALLGPQGLREIANTCVGLAQYFKKKVQELPGYSLAFSKAASFHEVLVHCPAGAKATQDALLKQGILAGYSVGIHLPEYRDHLLFCFTETNSLRSVDQLLLALSQVAVSRPLEGARA